MNCMLNHGYYSIMAVFINIRIPDIIENLFEDMIQYNLIWNADVIFRSQLL